MDTLASTGPTRRVLAIITCTRRTRMKLGKCSRNYPSTFGNEQAGKAADAQSPLVQKNDFSTLAFVSRLGVHVNKLQKRDLVGVGKDSREKCKLACMDFCARGKLAIVCCISMVVPSNVKNNTRFISASWAKASHSIVFCTSADYPLSL